MRFSQFLNEYSGTDSRTPVRCSAMVTVLDNGKLSIDVLSSKKLYDTIGKDFADYITSVEFGNYKCVIYVVNGNPKDYPKTMPLIAGAVMENAVTGRKLDYTVCGEILDVQTEKLEW